MVRATVPTEKLEKLTVWKVATEQLEELPGRGWVVALESLTQYPHFVIVFPLKHYVKKNEKHEPTVLISPLFSCFLKCTIERPSLLSQLQKKQHSKGQV